MLLPPSRVARGEVAAIVVTLITDVYCNATKKSALFANIPVSPSETMTRMSRMLRRVRAASREMTNITAEASRKRRNESVNGGNSPMPTFPAMAVPAQKKVASVI